MQFELTTINGISAINQGTPESDNCAVIDGDASILLRSQQAVCSLFLCVRHSLQGIPLVNSDQEPHVDFIVAQIRMMQTLAPPSSVSTTYAPFYDLVLS